MTVSRRKAVTWCSVAMGVAVLCYCFPPFRITPIRDAGSAHSTAPRGTSPANAADYAEGLWSRRLPEAFGDAVDIRQLFAAVDRNGAEACRKFGRQVGLGGACFLFVRGTGRVEKVDADYCTVQVAAGEHRVRIRTGVIVGNAVRDATGLVNVNQFANSQDFNNLSAELNQRVEADVIAPAREQLRVGARVHFVGCGQVDGDSNLDVFVVVPVRLDIENREVQP